MAEPFLGEIRMMSFAVPPKNWALCNGQIMQIAQNQALFALLGTSFGGDGRQTFALPNCQGRTPMHVGNGYALGQSGGEATHTLQPTEMPTHSHQASGSSGSASTGTPAGNVLGTVGQFYGTSQNTVPMSADTISNAGSGQAHPNMQPYCTISFCIALAGIFPPRS